MILARRGTGDIAMNDKVVGDASMGSTGAPLGQAYDFENSKSQLTGTVVQGKAPPRILAVEEVWEETANKFSIAKKWTIISVIFMVQVSMNFNTSLYSNAITGMSHEFDIDEPTARLGAMVFLVMYAFGCEIWAPFSEEFGRKPVIQLSLLLVNIFQIPVAVATNFPTVLAGRALGGLSTAGGSVTLGMIADMWQADEQQYAVAFVVFSSVAGSVFGPIVGGFVQTYCPWRWNIWIQLIFGMAVQALHFFLVPETRCTNMANTIAKNMRKTGADPNVYGPTEQKKLCEMFTMKELVETWLRPFKMFVTDPIVSSLSLLSGFSDALIFMFIQSFGLVYKQWHFNDWQLGLAFIPILIGYVAGESYFASMTTTQIEEGHSQ